MEIAKKYCCLDRDGGWGETLDLLVKLQKG